MRSVFERTNNIAERSIVVRSTEDRTPLLPGRGFTAFSFVGCVPFFERTDNIAECSIVVRSTEERTPLLPGRG